MDWHNILETAFLVAFWAGLAFTVGAALLSGAFHSEFGSGSAFSGGHAADLGGADVETGHFESGQPHVGWTDNHFPGASPLSPTVLAAALTGFGAVGYASLAHWDFGTGGSFALGVLGSLVLGGVTFVGLDLLFRKTQASSHVTSVTLVGTRARVTAKIESGQAGAITIEAMGSRMTVPARAADAAAIPEGAEIEIRRADGPVYVVAETRESWVARSRSNPDPERWS